VTVTRTRSALYSLARFFSDVEAIRRQHKVPKRVANKLIGRNIVRRLWR
jgi:hypothetical protein